MQDLQSFFNAVYDLNFKGYQRPRNLTSNHALVGKKVTKINPAFLPTSLGNIRFYINILYCYRIFEQII